MLDRIREDISCVFERDPAARSTWEVITCYPGFHALLIHRLAHWLWRIKMRLLPRLLSHFSPFLPRIEVYPGAKNRRAGVFRHRGGGLIRGTAGLVGGRAP